MLHSITRIGVLVLSALAIPGQAVLTNSPPIISHVTLITVPPSVMKWDTQSSDKTASWPDASDPVWTLPVNLQERFACIRYHESRNHLVDTNTSSNAQGWYQFTPFIWDYARKNIANLPPTPNQATGDQQSMVAIWYWSRNNGFNPEWSSDHC